MKIKICGITRLEDALLAYELGAWAVGFIFYKKSPRYIDPLQAKEIISQLPENIKKIGVFVNSSIEEILEVDKIANLTTFQLHGEESIDFCSDINLSKEVIKAFRPESESEIDQISDFHFLNTFLIDAKVKGEYGGTGHKANWELAKKTKSCGNLILAGGINSENILSAINEISPFAIDLSSSVEDSPGIKNKEKMKEIFKIVEGVKNISYE